MPETRPRRRHVIRESSRVADVLNLLEDFTAVERRLFLHLAGLQELPDDDAPETPRDA